MLARSYKLKSEADFSKVYKFGRRQNLPLFAVRYFFDPKVSTKIAVVASIKAVGKANERNRARRRIWSALSKVSENIPKKGVLLIFTAQKAVNKSDWANLSKLVEEVINNIANIRHK
jgi:ribonuclease P protein component